MSYIGVKINSIRQKIAGMPLMDVAFSNRSTNGLQNKIITAKKDEIEGRLDDVEEDLGDVNNLLAKKVICKYIENSSNAQTYDLTIPDGVSMINVTGVFRSTSTTDTLSGTCTILFYKNDNTVFIKNRVNFDGLTNVSWDYITRKLTITISGYMTVALEYLGIRIN